MEIPKCRRSCRSSIYDLELAENPLTPELRRLARYHYGVQQHASGQDLPSAVGALRAAVHDRPDDPGPVLQLARAVSDLVKSELMVEARTLYDRYVTLGATLGLNESDRDFVATELASQPRTYRRRTGAA